MELRVSVLLATFGFVPIFLSSPNIGPTLFLSASLSHCIIRWGSSEAYLFMKKEMDKKYSPSPRLAIKLTHDVQMLFGGKTYINRS